MGCATSYFEMGAKAPAGPNASCFSHRAWLIDFLSEDRQLSGHWPEKWLLSKPTKQKQETLVSESYFYSLQEKKKKKTIVN